MDASTIPSETRVNLGLSIASTYLLFIVVDELIFVVSHGDGKGKFLRRKVKQKGQHKVWMALL
jgi:bifunctional DNA-binding transcriptional regulator/antitoxin component of YhaV-PrlF toxin-antitoxin module